MNEYSVLTCYFPSSKDYFLWKTCLLFTTVNLPDVNIDDQNLVNFLNSFFFFVSSFLISFLIQVLHFEEEIASKLEQLKPLFRRTTIGKLRIIRGSTNIIRMFADVLEGAHLNHLESSNCYSDNDQ